MPDFTYRGLTLNSFFDKIFYINLKKDIARNENMLKQFGKYDITNFERFEAIEFQEIPNIEKYRNFNKTDAENRKYILGQLSCRASHISCIKMSKERNYTRVLILEDDATILQDPNVLLTQNQEILHDWDMLYFGGLIEPFYRNQIVCTHAYAVKNSTFNDIIYMAEASGMEIDCFYAKILQHMSYNHNQSGKYNIRIIVPFFQIIQNNSFRSNIV